MRRESAGSAAAHTAVAAVPGGAATIRGWTCAAKGGRTLMTGS